VSREVVSVLFEGDASDLLHRYAEGARRWDERGGVRPESAVIALGDGGLLVTLVWGEGVDHHDFGAHMLSVISELGLPRPTVNHGVLATPDWYGLVELAVGA
jgi:hypothetical protein